MSALTTLSDPQLISGLTVALGCGLLIGLEREQRMAADAAHRAAGVRTFALIGLMGAICGVLGPTLVAIGAGFVGIAALLSYQQTHADDPGLTTEVAMFVTFVLGVLALSMPSLAAALAVAVALILALKSTLHAFTREVLSVQELRDALLLIASALIVLPLLPDRAIDPWQVLNPYQLWRLVVLVMLINAAGYVAQRALGARLGLPISGFAGGFVSATATIAAMGTRALAEPGLRAGCIAASTLANVATVIQAALILAVLSPPLLQSLAWPLLAMGATALLVAGFFGVMAWRDVAQEPGRVRGRPFEPRQAIVFALVVSVILLAAGVLTDTLGDAGAIAASAFAGLADAHAATGSVAQVYNAERITLLTAGYAILAGLGSNTLSKIIIAFVSGGAAFGWRMLPGLVAMLLAFWVALAFVR